MLWSLSILHKGPSEKPLTEHTPPAGRDTTLPYGKNKRTKTFENGEIEKRQIQKIVHERERTGKIQRFKKDFKAVTLASTMESKIFFWFSWK